MPVREKKDWVNWGKGYEYPIKNGVTGKATQVSEIKSLKAVGVKDLKMVFAGKQWRILSTWGSVKQHLSVGESLMIPWPFKGLFFSGSLCGEFRSNIFAEWWKENRKTEQEKEERGKEIPNWSSDENIKGVSLEFKCKLILSLSPIYNDDLQGCHFCDVRITTASSTLTASYPISSLQIRSSKI